MKTVHFQGWQHDFNALTEHMNLRDIEVTCAYSTPLITVSPAPTPVPEEPEDPTEFPLIPVALGVFALSLGLSVAVMISRRRK